MLTIPQSIESQMAEYIKKMSGKEDGMINYDIINL
jgi:hypothetical protein